MNSMQEIGRNVMVMIGSVFLAAIVMGLLGIGLFYVIKSQFTPASVAEFLFG